MILSGNSPVFNNYSRQIAAPGPSPFSDDGCNNSLIGHTPELSPAGTHDNSIAKKKEVQRLIGKGMRLPDDGPEDFLSSPFAKKQVEAMNKGSHQPGNSQVGAISVAETFNAELDRRFGQGKGGYRYDDFGNKIYLREIKDQSGNVVASIWDHDHTDPRFS